MACRFLHSHMHKLFCSVIVCNIFYFLLMINIIMMAHGLIVKNCVEVKEQGYCRKLKIEINN